MIIKVTALVERNNDGYYSIISEDEVAGGYFGGYGFSEKEAVDDFYESIVEILEIANEEGRNNDNITPDDIEVEFKREYE